MTMLAQIPRHQLDERARKMTTTVSSDDRGMRQLALLRSGQPVAELMLQGSQAPIEAVQYLASEAKDRRSFVKFLVGDPGAGKSAIKQLLALEVAKIEDVIPVEYTLPSVSTFSLKVFVKCLFLEDALIRKAREKCIAIGYDSLSDRINNDFNGSGLYPIFRHIANPSTQYNHNQFASSISDWLVDGRKSLIRSTIGSDTDSSIHVGNSKYNQELLDVISDCIKFYAMIGIYPIWIIEEFESIASMRNGETGKMRVLTWMRDIVDCVTRDKSRFDNTPFGSGLLVLTTWHGMECVNQHPALADRIRGSKYFTHPNPVWEIKEFCKWDPVAIRCAIFSMYSSSAKHLNSTAIAVVNTYYKLELDERVKIDTYIDAILCDTHVEPRIKIKEVVTNVFDVMSNDSQWNARKIEILFTLAHPRQIFLPNTEENQAAANSWNDDLVALMSQSIANKQDDLVQDTRPHDESNAAYADTLDFILNSYGRATPTDEEYMRKPMRRTNSSKDDIYRSISDKCDLKNFSALGSKYAAMRDQCIDIDAETGKNILQFIKQYHPKQTTHDWRMCQFILGDIFKEAANGVMHICIEMNKDNALIPTSLLTTNDFDEEDSPGIDKLKLIEFNPTTSIGMMRTFAYIYCMRNGFIPMPKEMDQFILDQVKKIFNLTPPPARSGIAFYKPHLFGIAKKIFVLDSDLFLDDAKTP